MNMVTVQLCVDIKVQLESSRSFKSKMDMDQIQTWRVSRMKIEIVFYSFKLLGMQYQ